MNKNTEIGVLAIYRDKDMTPVYTKTYTLREYTDMIRVDLMRLISDVEDLCYEVNGNRAKEDWSDETYSAFSKIKHKLLDKAGDISRLPDNLIEIRNESLSDYIAKVIQEGG